MWGCKAEKESGKLINKHRSESSNLPLKIDKKLKKKRQKEIEKEKRKMNKQAQFFIIGAVILGMIILSVAVVWNATLKKGDIARKRFQALCENYKHEVFEVSKYAVATHNKSGEEGLIKDFTIKFLQDARSSEPGFLLLYVYGNSSYLTIFNATNSSVSVKDYIVNWYHDNGFSYGEIEINGNSIGSLNITINDKNINKIYMIREDEALYFIALEEKDGERYVCE